MADLLGILGMGATAKTKLDSATLEGQQVKRERDQRDLLATLAQQRQVAQDAQEAERNDLLNQLTRAQTTKMMTPEPPRVETFGQPFRALENGKSVFVERGNLGTTRTLDNYTPPPDGSAQSVTPQRGTPAYIAMLEAEAAARAKGGGAERGAQLPASAIERMIEIDDLIGQTKRARMSMGQAVADGRNVTGRVGGVVPVPNWVRNMVGQGGEEGIGARAELANITSSLIKLRSGAAVTTQEFARLEPFLANDDDDESVAMIKLRKLDAALEDMKRIRLENYQKYGKLGNQGSNTPSPPALEPDDLDAAINDVLGRRP